jgi:hypothetical protein
MARSTRTNFAKVKIWMPNMISEVEGTISGVALECFTVCGDHDTREATLKAMQARHDAITAREIERAKGESA